ncbi:MAGUK p55 subfamily member 7 [Austrofundulus limnaeus]|uniref:MAGUK p55 subfamily member 7 n=1 Tax=Austrofundulus limnaeus TaxID=52670 RepID=A0A2I4CAB7_AUSLI|nr:PREDICTED: MAGUK p55 subfamily member 7-like [Austrofundulus limnaeus]
MEQSSFSSEPLSDREEDYRFLHSMLMEKKLQLLFKIHEQLRRFEKRSPVAVQKHAASLASEMEEELLVQGNSDEVKELLVLVSKPTFKSLLRVHDTVAQRNFEPTLPPIPDDAMEDEEDSVKIVSLVKTKEPLGATIKMDKSTGAIVVARIMRGGSADKSDLIHEGDELKEVNGVSLKHRKPKEILPLMACSQGDIKFKIIPGSSNEDMPFNIKKFFVRALFDYDPVDDPAIPCKDAALAFKRGDILRVVSMKDNTWWQACCLENGSDRAGLIPSKQLQGRRVALQRPKALFKPRLIKTPDDEKEFPVTEDEDYGAISGIHIAGLRRSFRLGRKSSAAMKGVRFRRWSAEAHGTICSPTYIEVIPYHKEPKHRHRLVVLVGPGGVGTTELKRRLVISDPDHYGTSVPYTTREKRKQEREGVDYHFVSVQKFEEDILNQRIVEYGQYKGHYYGTNLDAVHRVMAEGKVCLLDVHPSKIGCVYSFEFKPYVVFVKPPRIEELRLTRRRAKFVCDEENTNQVRIFSEEDFEDMIDLAEIMESLYGHLFDKVIVNGDIAAAFRTLKADLEKMEEAEVQWVPAEWICSTPTKVWRSCSHLTSWI